MLICLCINYDRDHMAQKASNIYSLALYKKKKKKFVGSLKQRGSQGKQCVF